ncbi:hypothetical protein [Exiguobacterium sp. s191]|uniref:hypothetical protein n=1 Tax=Exiguobacterium sp. s191 TaxID=2751196 RepID=UPI001BEB71E2|nr:hypothetical protein [Exiguobacterium sp. s191]
MKSFAITPREQMQKQQTVLQTMNLSFEAIRDLFLSDYDKRTLATESNFDDIHPQ